MAGEQWQSIQGGSSRGNPLSAAVSGFSGAQRAFGNISDRITQDELNKQKLEQQALLNQRAQEQLDIQKAQESRAAETYAGKQTDKAAVTNALQSQLVNPELLGKTEDVYKRIDAMYKDTVDPVTGQTIVAPEKLALYEKANQALMPSGSLRTEYSAPLNPAEYQKRVMGDLEGVSPEARLQALNLLKAQYPAGSTADLRKAEAKALAEGSKAKLGLIGKSGVTTTTTGGGSGTSGEGKVPKTFTGIADAFVDKKGIGENWNPSSLDASQIRELGLNLDAAGGVIEIDGKPVKVSRNEFLSAAQANADFKDGNWVFDEGVDKAKFFESLQKVAGTSPDSGSYGRGSGGNKVKVANIDPSAFGAVNEITATNIANQRRLLGTTAPETAQAAVDRIFKGVFETTPKADAKPKQTAPVNAFDTTTAIGSAMRSPSPGEVMAVAVNAPDVFTKEYGKLSKAQQNSVDAVLARSVPPETNVAPEVVDKANTVVASQSPEVQQNNLDAIAKASNESSDPYTVIRDNAVKAYDNIEKDKKLSPLEAGALQLLQRGIYAGSYVPEGLSAIDRAITAGDRNLEALGSNALTGIGNIFRARDSQQPYKNLPGYSYGIKEDVVAPGNFNPVAPPIRK